MYIISVESSQSYIAFIFSLYFWGKHICIKKTLLRSKYIEYSNQNSNVIQYRITETKDLIYIMNKPKESIEPYPSSPWIMFMIWYL